MRVLLQVGPANLIRVAGGLARDRNRFAAREDGITFTDSHLEVCRVEDLKPGIARLERSDFDDSFH